MESSTSNNVESQAMKAIVVTDKSAGTAGMKLVERPRPQAAINDVVVQVYASGFVPRSWNGPPPGLIASAITGHRQSLVTSWPEWLSPSAMVQPDYQ